MRLWVLRDDFTRRRNFIVSSLLVSSKRPSTDMVVPVGSFWTSVQRNQHCEYAAYNAIQTLIGGIIQVPLTPNLQRDRPSDGCHKSIEHYPQSRS